MGRWVGRFLAAVAVAAFAACGSSGNKNTFSGADDGGSSGGDDGASSSDSGDDSTIHDLGDGAVSDAGNCIAPDMLIVLDHTDSMSAEPSGKRPPNTLAGHALSKWVLATQAIKAVVAPPADQKVAFGLELFPLDPKVVTDAGGTGQCVTLTQLLGGTPATNTSCQPGEVLVAPAAGTGGAIATILDPETLRLCVSTPIALALGTARAELVSIAQPTVKQYVLLVTDGGETCKGDVVGITQQLAAAGVKTYVVGFGGVEGGSGGVNVGLLDDVACAGMTAPKFPAPCTQTSTGYVATSKTGAPLFYSAEDGATLQAALQSITGSVCCGCAQ
ncbi:MAG TPA: hypothetical protein VIF15_09775 [Polyangiaceae bacterium]